VGGGPVGQATPTGQATKVKTKATTAATKSTAKAKK
jgi:hypothetical protein